MLGLPRCVAGSDSDGTRPESLELTTNHQRACASPSLLSASALRPSGYLLAARTASDAQHPGTAAPAARRLSPRARDRSDWTARASVAGFRRQIPGPDRIALLLLPSSPLLALRRRARATAARPLLATAEAVWWWPAPGAPPGAIDRSELFLNHRLRGRCCCCRGRRRGVSSGVAVAAAALNGFTAPHHHPGAAASTAAACR